MDNAAVNCEYFAPDWLYAFLLFGIYPGVSILGHRVTNYHVMF